MYLIACNCDASLYSFTDSLVRLHGGLWYFQLPLKPIHCIHISIANVVVANILHLLMSAQLMMPFLVATTRETVTVVMKTTMATMTWTMVPKIPFPHPLQVVTPLLLLPILSNQVVTEMLLVAARDDADVMLLSSTNNSLQQHISSSDSSSLIGPHQNPDCNAHAKAHSYKFGDDSSHFGTDCTSSNEIAMVDAGDSSFPIPNLFKPSPRSCFKVSNVPLSKG
jgi:hypothetical protein